MAQVAASEKRDTIKVKLEALGKLQAKAETTDDKELTDDINKTRFQITNMHWDYCEAVADSVVADSLPANLSFDAEQIRALGFASYNFGVFPWEAKLAERLARECIETEEYTFHIIPNAYNAKYHDFMHFDTLKKLDLDRKVTLKKARMATAYMQELEKFRNEAISTRFSGGSRDTLSKCAREMDEVFRPFAVMENVMQKTGFSTKEARMEFLALKQRIAENVQTRNQILAAGSEPDANKDVQESFTDMDKAYKTFLSLRHQIAALDKEIAVYSQPVKPTDARGAVKDEVRLLKSLAQLASRRAKLNPTSVPFGDMQIATPWRIARILDQIMEFDPGVFDNRSVKRFGKPAFLLIPALGNGLFDGERNRILIPTMPAKTLLESVATALVMYRMDVDSHEGDRKLVNSFRDEIDTYNDIRSFRVLSETMTEDYVTWITKEAQGFALFDEQVRKWFEFYIAPKKGDPMTPSKFRGRNMKQLNEILEGLNKLPETKEKYEKIGCIYYWQDKYDDALAAYEKAVQMDSDYLRALYGVGVICAYKKKNTARAKEAFNQYVQKSAQSWWASKAIEHLSKLKG